LNENYLQVTAADVSIDVILTGPASNHETSHLTHSVPDDDWLTG